MAYITYNRGIVNNRRLQVGIPVEDMLDSEEISTFASDLSTFIGSSWSDIVPYFKYRAPFDTTFQTMTELCQAVYSWWILRKPNFVKIKSMLAKEYDPLDNYHVVHTGTVNQRDGQISDVGSRNTSNGDTETENEVAPYDSSTYNKESKSHTTYSEDIDTGNTRTYTELKDTVNDEKKGNISMLITPQALAQEEIVLRLKNNLMDMVIKEFIREFCVAVYN